MTRWLLVALALALAAACTSGSSSSSSSSAGSGADPWAGKGSADSAAPAGPTGDIGQMLQNAAANLARPGPYEAPESSPTFAADKPHWGVLTLSGGVTEVSGLSLTAGVSGTELRELMQRLRELSADAALIGLVVRVEDLAISMPDALELHGALGRFRAAGKKLHCHTESATNVAYVALTACERIGVAPLGQVLLSGPAAMPVHVKQLLDNLGIKADFLHVGDYKGAAEPLTRDEPSDEMIETIDAILDAAYASMVETVAASRNVSVAGVKDLVDRALFPAEQALAAKLVDAVEPFDRFVEAAAAASEPPGAWTKIRLGKKDDAMAAMVKLAQFLGAMPTIRPSEPHVALVYAVGSIVDGDGDGILGAREQIAARTLVPALQAIAADDRVKSVVLRIDSGGGSALASELIWRAVAELKTKKPIVVSMSDVAASGGYYIACGATRIFAQANTLTGSIGVVGGKLAPGKALEKVGISTFPMGRGKRATMFARLEPWREGERAVIRDSMESVYETFLQRVAAGRGKTRNQIHAIAQGRVWTGARAKELGLVDDLGGLDAALAEARRLGGVADDIALEVYPPMPTLRDFLVSFGAVELPFGLDAVTARVAREISPEAAAVIDRALATLVSFRTTPVQTVALTPLLLP
jgi:protease-4